MPGPRDPPPPPPPAGSPSTGDSGPPTWVIGQSAPGGEKPGDRIGPYRLLAILGEGGFGVVWLAERREPMVQRVALKIIKAGMDTKAVVARFEQERQALAVMDHPNVAKVFDGGMTPAEMGSRPYFVMEQVKGEPITTYCDRHRLTLRQRLELFIHVCDAVQHAHMKGIIHRDIKPSNILVSVMNSSVPADQSIAEGVAGVVNGALVKVIDFGVAKAISCALTDKTIYTETGQLIGTPEYMSPEQVEMGALDIDTRTDVYSLGVLLYEVLTGLLPFDTATLRSHGYAEIQRIIREVDPPTPSKRLTGVGEQSAGVIAQKRQQEREELAHSLRTELEWIPLKAMRKDRALRYGTPMDLVRDIRNYLEGRPLEAGPEGHAYRFRKFVRRNRGAAIAIAAVSLALIGGIIGTTLGFLGQRRLSIEASIKADAALAAEAMARKAVEEQAKDQERTKTALKQAERDSYAANIVAASQARETGKLTSVREALAACPVSRRGWEWGQMALAVDAAEVVLAGFGGDIVSASPSADGSRVAVATTDAAWVRDTDGAGTPVRLGSGITSVMFAGNDRIVGACPDRSQAIVWTADGKEVQTLPGDCGRGAIITPNGKSVLSISSHGGGQWWRSLGGEPAHTFAGSNHPISIAAFSPTGDVLATGADNGQVCVWTFANGAGPQSDQSARHSGGKVTSLRFSRFGNFLLSTGSDGQARVTSTGTAGTVLIHKPLVPRAVLCGALSPDERQVAFAADGGEVVIANAKPPGETLWNRVFDQNVLDLAFSPDGRTLACACDDGGMRLFTPSVSTDDAGLLVGHHDRVLNVHWLGEGRRLMTVGADQTIRVFRAEQVPNPRSLPTSPLVQASEVLSPDGARLLWPDRADVVIADLDRPADRTLLRGTAPSNTVSSSGFAPDGRIWTRGREGTCALWRADGSGTELEIGPGLKVSSVTIQPGESAIVIYGGSPSAWLWRSKTDKTELRPYAGAVRAAEFSRDGRWLLLVDGARARVFDAANSLTERLSLTPLKDRATAAAISPDSRLAAAGSDLGQLRVWPIEGSSNVCIHDGHRGEITCIAFSPDSKRMISCSADATARVWDADRATAHPLVLARHDQAVLGAAFNPDGSRIVTGSADQKVIVWDAATGRPLLVLAAGHTPVRSVAFTPDGTRILAMCGDNLVRIWDSIPASYRYRQQLIRDARIKPDELARMVADHRIEEWEAAEIGWRRK